MGELLCGYDDAMLQNCLWSSPFLISVAEPWRYPCLHVATSVSVSCVTHRGPACNILNWSVKQDLDMNVAPSLVMSICHTNVTLNTDNSGLLPALKPNPETCESLVGSL